MPRASHNGYRGASPQKQASLEWVWFSLADEVAGPTVYIGPTERIATSPLLVIPVSIGGNSAPKLAGRFCLPWINLDGGQEL